MDHILNERRVIYRWKDQPSQWRKRNRWHYVETWVVLTPDVSEDPGLQAQLQKHLSEGTEILFIGPSRELYEGVRWGATYNVKRGEVSHLIGPR